MAVDLSFVQVDRFAHVLLSSIHLLLLETTEQWLGLPNRQQPVVGCQGRCIGRLGFGYAFWLTLLFGLSDRSGAVGRCWGKLILMYREWTSIFHR